MKVFCNHYYSHPLPEGHRFPMLKYELIPEQLLYEGTLELNDIVSPEVMSHEQLLLVHTSEYISKLERGELSKQEERKTGFPWSTQLVYREKVIMNGTWQAALAAKQDGVSMNVAGGTHHAYADRGEGFCLFNDLAIAAASLLKNDLAKKVLIIDLDVHQGNGTAAIFQGNQDVFTFSMHGKNNYPLHKEQSHLDVELPDGIADEAYLHLLKQSLENIEQVFVPDFVLYQCGVDILESDKLGRLGVSLSGCKERDAMVMKFCLKHKTPLVAAMGGGYSEDIKVIVEAHCNTFRLAKALFF
jgi:acetoin utilization deacetylase AcuC-like enzyme